VPDSNKLEEDANDAQNKEIQPAVDGGDLVGEGAFMNRLLDARPQMAVGSGSMASIICRWDHSSVSVLRCYFGAACKGRVAFVYWVEKAP
jgi:hypothetical protein